MDYEELQKENEELHAKVIDQENDIREIGIGLYKTLEALGLDSASLKDPKEAQKKVMKSIPGIITQAMTDPDGIAEKFSHLSAFAPLLIKYEHVINDIVKNGN